MRAQLLCSIALPLVLSAPAFAQQAADSQQPTPDQQVQQQPALQSSPTQPRIRQNPQAAAVTDDRSMPGFFLARARDADGNTVLMLVNPDTGEAIPLGTPNQRRRPQRQQALEQQQEQVPPQQAIQQPQQQAPSQQTLQEVQQQLQQLRQQALQQQALQQLQQQHQMHGPQKTIGHARTEVTPSLIVFNARGASLQGGKLVLIGVSPNTILFADRPARAAGQDLTAHIIDDWANGSENFADDPPNATVSGYNKQGVTVHDAVVVLKTPKLDGDQLTFNVDVLEGDLNGADGPAALFIDTSDRSSMTTSAVGGARPAAQRGAWYAGANGTGSGSTAANGGYAACGRYPYPAC